MGLLGGGDESLSANSGWGILPPLNSSADWGSSSSSSAAAGGSSSSASSNHWASSSGGSSSGVSAGSNSTHSSNGGSSSSGSTLVGRQNALSNHNSASSSASAGNASAAEQLSSSPKPSGSWAQAAGKGLVSTGSAVLTGNSSLSSIANGPNSCSMGSNSHETGSLASGQHLSALSLSLQSQSLQSSSSSSSQSTNANLNGGLSSLSGGCLSNVICSSSSAFQGSSNSNSNSGGLIAGSSSNPIDAAAGKRPGGPAPGQMSDLIGQLNEDFRETLLTEKWGATVINQDSPWNLPPSPPRSSPKLHGGSDRGEPSTWRPSNSNSGTEIWESTVRQKKGSMGSSGSGSLSSSMGLGAGGPAQPWQAPTTHIGGTWGEEEDSSNHWTGVPQSSSLNSVNSVSGGPGSALGMGGPGHLGVNGMAGPSGGPLSAMGNSSINTNWSAGSGSGGLANGNGGGNGGSGLSSYSLLNPTALGSNSMGPGDGPNSWNGNDGKSSFESRAKGPSGGAPTNWGNFDNSDSVSESNWDNGKSMGGNEFGTWNAPEKKDPAWEKESNADGYKGPVDDGTAVWGNPRGGSSGAGGPPPPTRDQQRGAPPPNWNKNDPNKYGNKNGMNGGWSANGNGGNKSGNGGGNQPGLTRTWTEPSGHRKSPSMWNDEAKSLNGNMTPGNWNDGQIDTSSWNAGKAGKPLTRELILSSKPFRLLLDLGYKKEDAENALRNSGLRLDDALVALSHTADLDQNKSLRGYGNPLSMAKNTMVPPLSANPMGGGNGGVMLNPNNPSATNPSSLRNLMQRIQLAVYAGYLNPQILNQPLSSQNLEILSELLHQIKQLKEIQGIVHLPQYANMKGINEMKMTQIKQCISSLQSQLAGRTEGMSKPMGGGPGAMDAFGGGLNQQTSGADLYGRSNDGGFNSGQSGGGSGAGGGGGAQGSRLLSWKNNSYNKQQSNEDKLNQLGADFSRAPGGLAKQNSTPAQWGGNFMDDPSGGWPADLGKHDKGAEMASAGLDDYSLGNFPVQDSFDSYKSAWKPTAKSGLVDDDPRSPISTNASMLKDSMFSWNTNPNSKANSLLSGNGAQGQMGDSFAGAGGSNNPWSYSSGGNGNQSGASQMFPGDMKQKKTSGTWNADYSESLWNPNGASNGAGSGSGKPRPPPGLSKNANSSSSSNSIWSSAGSEYLRLRNLTPQIDGSTLKTLCLQHGPLHLFHLFLSHGTAIARYANRDQAIKAQSALNNCVLGNTTILADLPPESEVQQYLQLINGGGHSSNPNGGSSSNGGSSGHQSHPSVQTTLSQSQSHHQHQHGGHHTQGYNASWSNGTNASQSTAGAGGVSSSSSQQQSVHSATGGPSAASLYSRTGSVNAGAPGNGASAFGASFQPNSSPASTLPYGGAASGVPTHSSYTVLNQASAAANQFSKMDNGLLSGWNSSSASTGLWDSSALPGGAGSMWSTAGFSAADRNTPIQNFLPGDLLAGDNN